MQGDFPVKACSQEATTRQTVNGPVGVAPSAVVCEVLATPGLPRVFVYANQTTGGLAASLKVEIAYRMDATGLAPEWLLLSNAVALVPGGLAPTGLNFAAGALWWRFTVTLAFGEVVEIAAAGFV